MKKLFFAITVVLLFMGCYKETSVPSIQEPAPEWDVVYSADEIEIREALISFGKRYNIYVDSQKVGQVTGEFIHIAGDTFTMADNDGNVIMSEKQERQTFSFFIDRLAVVYASDGSIHGFFTEEVVNDFFNPFTWFYFYDAEQNELGKYKAKIALVKTGEFEDAQGNVEYRFEKAFNSLTDTYTLYVRDNDDIPLEYAIFMVCIQDAIGNAAKDD